MKCCCSKKDKKDPVKYATEDNIRSLILLIKNELEGYVTKEYFMAELDKKTNPLSFKKVNELPDVGESNVIYLIPNNTSNGLGYNLYDEYFWDADDSRFELLGSPYESSNNSTGDGPSLYFERVYALPEVGEPNVIYLLENGGSGNNIYSEYFWDDEYKRFELFGAVETDILEGSSAIIFEKVQYLPDRGKPNVIYLVQNGDSGINTYNEYFWDEEDESFELFGAVDTGMDDIPIPNESIDDIFDEDVIENG